MNLVLAVLVNITFLVIPYIILLVPLCYCAIKHNMTLVTLLNKYKKARNLFEMTSALQLIIFIIALVYIMTVTVNSPDEIHTPTEFLIMLVKLIYLMDAIIAAPLIVDDITDTIRYINKNLYKESVKKSIKKSIKF